MILFALDLLIVLVAFSCQDDDISGLAVKDGVTDCFFSIGDLDIFSVGLLDAALNVIQENADYRK